ncbi:MAG: hypothetical protein A2275_00075 [Bacteroidetes bacterium RIFOXYA12_FULL_35_11]|nr:MAG: hypothetical protein A2X01_06785 [Bacteroidetes bacterium GWF2_35_48]OFY81146.1 MAG: hypothetical protein A2275_00075 [Bacteroidetes bacterium RIFOXYA12_FULL_35_11]OFY98945.1 MAG: hypothetical protein A2491_12340 [Bacteroidetes bacterium RIFOXYC12_FULL_35_7]HBX49774.1 hypothetical protein [Bacteroidales bacterium]
MKHIFLFSVFILFSGILFSQNEVDALRYSQSYVGGTARYTSMSGAFGALGGDMSVLNTNPAGIGIYRSSEIAITPSFFYNKAQTDYYSSPASDYKYSLNLGNIGFVSTYKSDNPDSDWKTTSFGIVYNKTNKFDYNYLVEGTNNNSSMIDFFLNRANGNKPENLDDYMERLAFNTWLIDTLVGNPLSYFTSYSGYGETQRKVISSSGSTGEYAFSLGSNYKDILYLGAALTINRIDYEENSTYTELAKGSILGDLESFSYSQSLATAATGYSFKLGAILRPIDWLRVGGAIHTPIFYSLEDKFSSKMDAKVNNGDYYISSSKSYLSEYELTTPVKALVSAGFTIRKMAIIGIDYEFVDYSTARLRDASLDYSYNDENKAISTNYKAASNIRAGAEYMMDNFRVRCGMAYYGSPYKSGHLNAKSYGLSYSGGFGIRSYNFFLDFAYVHFVKQEKSFLYTVPEPMTIESVKVKTNSSQLLITLGYKF